MGFVHGVRAWGSCGRSTVVRTRARATRAKGARIPPAAMAPKRSARLRNAAPETPRNNLFHAPLSFVGSLASAGRCDPPRSQARCARARVVTSGRHRHGMGGGSSTQFKARGAAAPRCLLPFCRQGAPDEAHPTRRKHRVASTAMHTPRRKHCDASTQAAGIACLVREDVLFRGAAAWAVPATSPPRRRPWPRAAATRCPQSAGCVLRCGRRACSRAGSPAARPTRRA